MSAPKVRVQAMKSKDGALWDLVCWCCPYCFQEHRHGAGSVAESPEAPAQVFYGLRMAHCKGVPRSTMYELVNEEAPV